VAVSRGAADWTSIVGVVGTGPMKPGSPGFGTAESATVAYQRPALFRSASV
jgi:hypothetical protein